MNYSSPTRIAFVLIGLLALMQPIRAQLKMPEVSPSTTVKQKIGFTDLTITYARPATKGRVIFGSLVPYGQLWRTGAGDATTLTRRSLFALHYTGADGVDGDFKFIH
jgi:hypothetical protein